MRFWSRSWTMPRTRPETPPSRKPPRETGFRERGAIEAFDKDREQPGRDMLSRALPPLTRIWHRHEGVRERCPIGGALVPRLANQR
jgi:hypothetical protein